MGEIVDLLKLLQPPPHVNVYEVMQFTDSIFPIVQSETALIGLRVPQEKVPCFFVFIKWWSTQILTRLTVSMKRLTKWLSGIIRTSGMSFPHNLRGVRLSKNLTSGKYYDIVESFIQKISGRVSVMTMERTILSEMFVSCLLTIIDSVLLMASLG